MPSDDKHHKQCRTTSYCSGSAELSVLLTGRLCCEFRIVSVSVRKESLFSHQLIIAGHHNNVPDASRLRERSYLQCNVNCATNHSRPWRPVCSIIQKLLLLDDQTRDYIATDTHRRPTGRSSSTSHSQALCADLGLLSPSSIAKSVHWNDTSS